MNIARSTAALVGAFSLSASLAHGQATLFFEDVKNFKMTGPNESEYLGGSWNLRLRDGLIFYLPCWANFGPFFTGPTTIPPCQSGTTGLITQGDLDGDGIRDVGVYLSVANPVPARQVEPFQTGLVELSAGPPSSLPRPLGGFNWIDTSVVAFYDLVNDPINGVGYEVTIYDSTRPYDAGVSGLEKHRDEIVPGTYTFSFPVLGSDEVNRQNFYVNSTHREMVEAVAGPGGRDVESGGIAVGNDFRLTNDDRWHDGVMEFDPRILFDFTWVGFNAQTFVAGDSLYFSVRERDSDRIRFPPIPDPVPGNPHFPQLIGNSNLGIPSGYELGPDFFEPNLQYRVELEFRRSLPSGSSVDISSRIFQWDIDLTDTYEGFQRVNFPVGTSDLLIAPGADYDGDGYTNLEEFGFQTEILDPASVPNPTPFLDAFTSQCILDIPKRPGIGSRLSYQVQYSIDLETWTTIEKGDPNWFIVFDNEELLSVLSRRPATINPCFLRVQFEQN
jgi:hypothetical protein